MNGNETGTIDARMLGRFMVLEGHCHCLMFSRSDLIDSDLKHIGLSLDSLTEESLAAFRTSGPTVAVAKELVNAYAALRAHCTSIMFSAPELRGEHLQRIATSMNWIKVARVASAINEAVESAKIACGEGQS